MAHCQVHGNEQPCALCLTGVSWSGKIPAPPAVGSPGWVCPQCSRSLAPAAVCCPFCAPAWDCCPAPVDREYFHSQLPAMLSACKPSREGGMCGCGEPDDDPAVTAARDLLSLPADRTWITAADWDWAEVHPGLQCRVRNLSVTERPLDASPFSPPPLALTLEFRRLDGQDHD